VPLLHNFFPGGEFERKYTKANSSMRKTLWSSAQVIQLTLLLGACGGCAPSSPAQVALNLTVTPTSLNLGSVPVSTPSAAQMVTGTNNSTGSITVDSIATSSPFASTGITLPATLNSGQSLTLFVTFTPASSGAATGTLTVTSTAGNSPVTVALAGTGTSSSATVNINPGMDIPSVVSANPAGTTFVILPGVYRTQEINPKDGDIFIGQTACAPPNTPCPAILNGSELLTSFQFDGTNYFVTGQTQQGFVSIKTAQCETGWEACIYPEDLYFDNVPLQHVTTLAAVAPGKWFFDYTNHIIYFRDNPAGHTVETSVTPLAFTAGPANNLTVQYLTIEKFAVPVLQGAVEGSNTGFCPPTAGVGWVVRNNEISLNHSNAVRACFGWQVLNNYSHDNGDFGMAMGVGGGNPDGTGTLASNILIQGNEISHNDYARVMPAFGAGGIKGARTRGLIFRGNYVHDNHGPGLWTDISNYDGLYDNNTIADNDDSGAFHEISYGATVMRNNKLLRNAYNVPANGSGGFRTNLFSSTSQGVEAYCNTIEVSATGGNAMVILASDRGSDASPPSTKYISSGNYFHHNTVSWDGSGNLGAVGGVNYDTTGQPNFYTVNPGFDYNEYHLPSLSNSTFQWAGNSAKTFAQFQAAGMDTHGTADTQNTASVPNVTMTSPADGSTVSGAVSVTGNVQDTSGISKVDFYVDWSLQSTATSNPFNFGWNTSGVLAGPHTLAAMAYNINGIRACYGVTVKVQ
jgi:hypothetical protein